MSFEIIIKEEAYHDLQDAYDYYELLQSGLGERFLKSVRERIAYIKEYPLHFAVVEKDFRQSLVDKFPYLIIYEVAAKEIIVYAVFQGNQDPDKKFRNR